jgi:hypothetical protein
VPQQSIILIFKWYSEDLTEKRRWHHAKRKAQSLFGRKSSIPLFFGHLRIFMGESAADGCC